MRLSFDNISKVAHHIDPVFTHSPQFWCEPLSAALGVKVLLKVETINPIRCFKGRGAEVLLSKADGISHIVCASAGNFGQAMAYACRKRGVKITVFASVNANPLKIDRMKALGADVVLAGEDFDAAKLEAKKQAAAFNARFVEDGLDVETIEGAGSIGLELLELPVMPDVILIPLGNGALFNGVATVLKAKSPAIKLIAVQAKGAPAMIDSWKQNRMIVHDTMNTISDGIAVRIPIAQALDEMRHLADDGILVSDEATLKGMKLLHQHAGLVVEPSGAVGIAAILENKERFQNKSVALILCGSNLTPQQVEAWLM